MIKYCYKITILYFKLGVHNFFYMSKTIKLFRVSRHANYKECIIISNIMCFAAHLCFVAQLLKTTVSKKKLTKINIKYLCKHINKWFRFQAKNFEMMIPKHNYGFLPLICFIYVIFYLFVSRNIHLFQVNYIKLGPYDWDTK